MEGMGGRWHEAVEVEAGGCAGSRCLEEWHFGEPPSPCKRGNMDVKPMTMRQHSKRFIQKIRIIKTIKGGYSKEEEINMHQILTTV